MWLVFLEASVQLSRCLIGTVLLAASGLTALAQQTSPSYVVKQDWVQGDENYLASDALRGRGQRNER